MTQILGFFGVVAGILFFCYVMGMIGNWFDSL